MPIQKQLSVFMPNRPGVLAQTCSILSDAGINILAMAVHDTVDNAVVRFLLDQPTKALLLLEQEELYVLEQEVAVIELTNAPGELARICQALAAADINIYYAYCTGHVLLFLSTFEVTLYLSTYPEKCSLLPLFYIKILKKATLLDTYLNAFFVIETF